MKNKLYSLFGLNSARALGVLLLGFFSHIGYSADQEDLNCPAPWSPNATEQELEPLRSLYAQFALEAAVANQLLFKDAGRSCLVTFAETKNIKNVLYVDVRDKRFYEGGHIPTAVNIPAHLLNTKPFLKKRPIVLVDHGYRHLSLLPQCEKLVEQGFRAVYVLSGGYFSPRVDEQNKQEKADDKHEFPMISPKEFSSAKEKDKWIIFTFDPQVHDSQGVYSFNLNTPKEMMREKMRQKLESFAKEHGFAPLVLAVNERGVAYDEVAEVFPDGDLGYLYFLEGGTEAYDAFMQKQRKILERKKAASQKRVESCF